MEVSSVTDLGSSPFRHLTKNKMTTDDYIGAPSTSGEDAIFTGFKF